MNEQIKEIEKAVRKFPSFMTPCVVEQGIIIYPKRRRASKPRAGKKEGRTK